MSVGLQSLGSFTTSFTRTYGVSQGIDSSFRDPSGNHFRLTQVRELANV